MYETFFGLKRRPFPAVPDTESYFSVARMEESRQAIERTVRRGEGISLIFGPSGTGKTLLLRLLRQALDVEYTVTLIANGHLETPKSFFQQLLYELRLPFSNTDETELRLVLQEFARQETTPGLVLLIDESQFLSRTVLEEIRLLMNCDDGAVPYFRAVLAGTPEFEEKLTHPHLEAFDQRVVSRSYLEPFTREETYRYIARQTGGLQGLHDKLSASPDGLNEFIDHSGTGESRRLDSPHVKGSDPIFTENAKRQIHQLTEGLPRLINQLCDTAMQLAAERVCRHVDEPLIHSAWAKLRQIDDDASDRENRAEAVEEKPERIENIEEIIARKKATFQVRQFDSTVEFGTLDESARQDERESVATEFVRSPNEYKPPYPEDDDDPDGEIDVRIECENDLETMPPSDPAAPVASEEDETGIDSLVDSVDREILFSSDGEDATPESTHETNLESVSETGTENRDERRNRPIRYPVRTGRNPGLAEFGRPGRFVLRFPGLRPFQADNAPTAVGRRPRIVPISERKNVSIPRDRFPSGRETTWSFISFSSTFRRFETIEPWIGNVATRLLFVSIPLTLATKTVEADLAEETERPENVVETEASEMPAGEAPLHDRGSEELPMDQETLEKYGAEVLEGRPPFVRKEPNYAYRTDDSSLEKAERKETFPYPDPVSGNVILLNWSSPENHLACGFGTAYRRFAEREDGPTERPEHWNDGENGTRTLDDVDRVVRAALDEMPGAGMNVISARKTSLDEPFDEIVSVRMEAVPLNEVYRPELDAVRRLEQIRSRSTGDASERIDAVVKRITEAAEKIEKAAEISEDAGRHVKQAAVFVEKEVRAALPTYIELFQELSSFQKSITEELIAMQKKHGLVEPLPPDRPKHGQGNKLPESDSSQKVLPFPRRPAFSPPTEAESPPPSTGADEENVKDEKSIDLRTLFQ